jgi:Tfp pilus assembly protein PilF
MTKLTELEYSARRLLQAEDYRAALVYIKEALALYPNQLSILILGIRCYRHLHDRSESLKYAEILISHLPDRLLGVPVQRSVRPRVNPPLIPKR